MALCKLFFWYDFILLFEPVDQYVVNFFLINLVFSSSHSFENVFSQVILQADLSFREQQWKF